MLFTYCNFIIFSVSPKMVFTLHVYVPNGNAASNLNVSIMNYKWYISIGFTGGPYSVDHI